MSINANQAKIRFKFKGDKSLKNAKQRFVCANSIKRMPKSL